MTQYDAAVGQMWFSGNTLNRASWLREDNGYLREAYERRDARFIVLNNLDPLTSDGALVQFKRDDIARYLPQNIFEDASGPVNVDEEDARPLVIFLGVEAQDGKGRILPERDATRPHSPPVFAIDITPNAQAKDALLTRNESTKFVNLRALSATLPAEDVAISGLARALIDWNRRNRYCAGCGKATKSTWAGWKRTCHTSADESTSKPCITKKGVHNFVYPRTDAVTIMAVLHPQEDKILLGRQKIWPTGFVSCLAGFLEPGETLEEAVAREVFEEAGVRVRNVRYVRSQPWPFPNSLMLGLVAEAEPNSEIRIDLDNELEHAGWYDRETILQVLENAAKPFSETERAKIDEDYGKKFAVEGENKAPTTLRLPPATAIAHHLIKLWAIGEVKRVGEPVKGRL